eukprot:1160859-Pelagomonas_calceolata.AAC.10
MSTQCPSSVSKDYGWRECLAVKNGVRGVWALYNIGEYATFLAATKLWLKSLGVQHPNPAQTPLRCTWGPECNILTITTTKTACNYDGMGEIVTRMITATTTSIRYDDALPLFQAVAVRHWPCVDGLASFAASMQLAGVQKECT